MDATDHRATTQSPRGRRRVWMPVVLLAWAAAAVVASEHARAEPAPCFVAAAWPEADSLFRRDRHWLGADGASSVGLGDGRVLWLFGDTWIDPTGRGDRHGARMVSNSVGIQTGPDPSRAEMSFHWGTDTDGEPRALFPDKGPEALWFGHGVNVDGRLVLFFARTLRNTGTGLGFEHAGWGALVVENPEDEPSRWRTRMLDTADAPQEILLGYASAFADDHYVYAFGSLNADKSHPIYAARWPRLGQRDVRLQLEGLRRGGAGTPPAGLPRPGEGVPGPCSGTRRRTCRSTGIPCPAASWLCTPSASARRSWGCAARLRSPGHGQIPIPCTGHPSFRGRTS